jgi:hypothetical protein
MGEAGFPTTEGVRVLPLLFALVVTAPAQAEEEPSYLLMNLLRETPLGATADAARFKITGWTDTTFTGSTLSGSLLPIGFNYRGNEWQVQQSWIRLEQSVDPKADHPTFGFTFDAFAGIDYRYTLARGLFNSQLTASNGQPNLYGADLPQFYVETHLPGIAQGLNVKVGRFTGLQGAEDIEATESPLASHSYSFLYTPFTHTGLLTDLDLGEDWSIQNGIVLGSDVFINPAASPTYIGGIKYEPPDGSTILQFDVILGSGRFNRAQQFTNLQLFDLLFSHHLSTDLKWELELMYGYTTNVPGTGFADWFSVVNYGTLKLTETLSTVARVEFYNDFQGQRTGFPGLYTTGTVGLNWKPCPALIFRPELRYDTCSTSAPFQGKHGLFTATFDVVLRY